MIVAPSILALDYSRFSEELDILNENSKWIHFDVMDGHFVKNLSFGPNILKAFRRNSSLFLDVHIMVDDPFNFAQVFAEAGADSISFHFEALNKDVSKCKELISLIKSNYLKAGISIKPETPIELIEPLLNDVDIVLVMSVEPGFGGQEFIKSSYDKIAYLKKYKDDNNLNYLIEVDGGIDDFNAHEIKKQGADILVAGSFIFNGDIKANIDTLQNI